MNRYIITLFLAIGILFPLQANNGENDSIWLFSYSSKTNGGRNGLHLAWSRDEVTWHSIGNEYGFLKCDYGQWGAEKRMVDPFLMQDNEGLWHCIWSLNETDKAFAHAASIDLVNWRRQSYPYVMQDVSSVGCSKMEFSFDSRSGNYIIWWRTKELNAEKKYKVTTKDFSSFSETELVTRAEVAAMAVSRRKNIVVNGNMEEGTINRVPWSLVKGLITAYEQKQYQNSLYGERASEDGVRFANLSPVDATILIDGSTAKPISDMLFGIFFEDINYAADGGLYAELIQNRDFEYKVSDKDGSDNSWNSKHSWKIMGLGGKFTIDTVKPIHPNNPNYAVMEVTSNSTILANEGYDGIALKGGETYYLSLFCKMLASRSGHVIARLVKENGDILALKTVKVSANWKRQEVVFIPSENANKARLEIVPQDAGKYAFDMVSLFPKNTFKERRNGLRDDIAQSIADLTPSFVRFPGGCVAHGDGIDNMYRWKNTIGDLEARVPQRNLWGYHQSVGLGYQEYFQFCEDIGAKPIPIIAAGVPCQNSHTGGGGQQGGIHMDEMDEYIQEIIDLIEYANGDSKKSSWGKVRAKNGHPAPFNLEYIGIGNEDLITDVFEERFTMIYEAIKATHPEITVIGTVGPFFEGTDYVEGWKLADKLNIPIVDEHYYNTPGWFIYNQDFYDKYNQAKSKVYLGEYAAHLPERVNNIETALAEALYLTSVERNGDIVVMTSYAPLLAKEGHTQWNPDLIYFNNTEVKPTVGYYVQQMYANNSGNEYISDVTSINNPQEKVKKRIGISTVRDTINNDVVIKVINMLPVEVNSNVTLGNITLDSSTASVTLLSGRPDAVGEKPVVKTIEVGENFTYTAPAYSFSVIRIGERRESPAGYTSK